jgi:ABC-type multidrug transport system ATPase subunit
MSAASFQSVVKRYGRQVALNELSFEIPEGAICGLIGPNGSGKTTTMGVLAGLLRQQSGTVDLLGQGAFSVEVHGGRVGIMPQDSVPSPHAPIIESLRYYAELQGMDPSMACTEAEKWLKHVHLADRGKSRYGALSHGMRRRFSVAQAMLGEPELILLDEPTSGLDPELVVEIRKLIVGLRGRSTVLVSSHILSELESMCDHAIFLEQGVCVRQGPMKTITGRDSIVRYSLDRKPELVALKSGLFDCTVTWENGVLLVNAPSHRSVTDINGLCLRMLLDAQVGILEVTTGDSLEDAYMESRKAKS